MDHRADHRTRVLSVLQKLMIHLQDTAIGIAAKNKDIVNIFKVIDWCFIHDNPTSELKDYLQYLRLGTYQAFSEAQVRLSAEPSEWNDADIHYATGRLVFAERLLQDEVSNTFLKSWGEYVAEEWGVYPL